MNAKAAIDTVRTALKSTEDDLISAKRLLRFLDELETLADGSLEAERRVQEFKLAEYGANVQSNLEMFKSVIEAGKEALNALILIGGGAIVGLLSLLGSKTDPALGRGMVSPLLLFGAAVLLGAMGHAFRYLCQVAYSGEWVKTGTGLTIITASLVVGGYCCFAWAAVGAAQAFSVHYR